MTFYYQVTHFSLFQLNINSIAKKNFEFFVLLFSNCSFLFFICIFVTPFQVQKLATSNCVYFYSFVKLLINCLIEINFEAKTMCRHRMEKRKTIYSESESVEICNANRRLSCTESKRKREYFKNLSMRCKRNLI